MTEYSRMAKGSFTSPGTSAIINLPFKPDYVELWNYTNIKTAGTHKVTRAWWDVSLLDGANNPTMIELYAGSSTATVFDTIQTNGISTFSGGLLLQYGAAQQIVGATAANPPVFNVTGHGYKVGDTVVFEGLYQTQFTAGMPQLSNIMFTIDTVTDANHFTVKWNASTSNYTALSGSPAGATVKKVLFPFLYVPQVNTISAITTGSTTTITTTAYHNFEVGQEIAFRIPSQFGTSQLNSLPNATIPGSPIYGYVTSITDNWTFVCNINSTGFTAYTANIAVTSLSGQEFPQVLAVGDVNTGGQSITATSPLYPPPLFPTSSSRVPTINGPAIKGAFVNNTSQGFVIGSGTAAVDTTSTIMTTSDIIYWHAYLHDFANP